MGVSRFIPRRYAAVALSLGIALSAVGGGVPVRAVSGIADPAGVAAHYVATKVEAGGLNASSLADAIFAFAAANAGATAASDALGQLKTKADAFMGYGGTLKPGAIGKVMLAVIVSGGDPTDFNGHNLETGLRGLQISGGADDGRFTGAEIYDQSLAILALKATPGGVPAGAADWLASKQCTAGDYAWDGSCPVASGAEDPDSTAIALQALLAAGSSAAADKAAAWLIGQQASNGSLASYGAANTTSTAAAAQALRAAGHATEANRAAAWVAGLQYGCSVAAASRGIIPWTAGDAGFDGGFASTAGGALAFGAGRLDALSLADAPATTPIVVCNATTPTPRTTGGVPTEPPTDTLGGRSSGGSSGGVLIVAVLALASSVLLVARRPGQRR